MPLAYPKEEVGYFEKIINKGRPFVLSREITRKNLFETLLIRDLFVKGVLKSLRCHNEN